MKLLYRKLKIKHISKGAKKMETKYFQVKMEEDAHIILKHRAKTMRITIGQMVQNMLSSLEFRLKRAYEEAEIENRSSDADRLLTEAILKADAENWSKMTWKCAIQDIQTDLLEDRISHSLWAPKIEFSNKPTMLPTVEREEIQFGSKTVIIRKDGKGATYSGDLTPDEEAELAEVLQARRADKVKE